MKILGIDFTSRPGRGKPLICVECEFAGNQLAPHALRKWESFREFEAALAQPGPWVAGIDFPFGQSGKFVRNIGWPTSWAGYVDHVASMSREQFRQLMIDYRTGRPAGDKEHKRETEKVAGAFSAQKIERPPVGLMFFEGAPRLRRAGVTIPGMQQGDPHRIVIEAFPSVLAKRFIGRQSYKHDAKREQTSERREARETLLAGILEKELKASYGLQVQLGAMAPSIFADDATGDSLDALCCAIQAAWSWQNRRRNHGIPPDFNPSEGWIVDPGLANTSPGTHGDELNHNSMSRKAKRSPVSGRCPG